MSSSKVVAKAAAELRDEKGDAMFADAEATLKKCGCFSGTQRFNDAAALFVKAGAQYKAGESWSGASVAFERAAMLFTIELKDEDMAEDEACNNFTEAGRCYKRFHPEKAIEMFNRAINVRVDNGAFPSAAKLCVEIAEIYLAEESFESSAEFFVKAADYYEASDRMEMSVLESQRRAADAFQQCGNWEKAIQLNESVCSAYSKKNSAANTLIVKELCFKNILLHLLDNQKSTKSFEVDSVKQVMESYVRRHTAFDRSEHLFLLTALLEAIGDEDVETFESAIFRYRQGHELRPWQVSLLLNVKKCLTASAESVDVDVL